MLNKYDLIEFPLPQDILGELNLVKQNNQYSAFIEENNIRKKIISTKKEIESSYFILEIGSENEEFEIIGEIEEWHEFNSPIDFVIPVSNETKEVYENIRKILESNNNEELIDLNEYLMENQLPLYPLPMFYNINHRDYKVLKENANKKIDEKSKEEELDLIAKNYVKKMFDSHPILRSQFIKNDFKKSFSEDEKNFLKFNKIKKYFKSFSEFIRTGPFQNCWIKKDFDFTNSKNLFIYQVVGKIANHIEFIQIFERPNLVEKIKNNETLYLKDSFDTKTGYLTNLGVQVLEMRNESSDENIYSLYD